jgi:transcriptional regulator with XRE-family HTH domain
MFHMEPQLWSERNHNCGERQQYAKCMKSKTALALAENVKRLMRDRGLSQGKLAEQSGVSASAIGYLLNYRDLSDRHAAVDTIEALAKAFDVEAWQLLIPDLDFTLLNSRRPQALLENFNAADEVERTHIERSIEGSKQAKQTTTVRSSRKRA